MRKYYRGNGLGFEPVTTAIGLVITAGSVASNVIKSKLDQVDTTPTPLATVFTSANSAMSYREWLHRNKPLLGIILFATIGVGTWYIIKSRD